MKTESLLILNIARTLGSRLTRPHCYWERTGTAAWGSHPASLGQAQEAQTRPPTIPLAAMGPPLQRGQQTRPRATMVTSFGMMKEEEKEKPDVHGQKKCYLRHQ